MERNEIIERFYAAVSDTLDRPITAESTLKTDLNLSSSGYFMIIAEMEELGAEDISYAMLRKCETMADAAEFLLSQLDT